MKKIFSILLVLVILLTACSGGKQSSKVFVRAGAAPESLDSTLISYSQSFDIAANNFTGIYEVNADGELVLSGADSVTPSEDGLTYTVKLRDDIKWVDSEGKEQGTITADDYLFTYQRILTAETKAPMAYLLQGVIVGADDYLNGKTTDFEKVGIKKIDDNTIEFKLNYVAPYFEGMLSFPTYYPQSKAAYEEFGDDYGSKADKIYYSGPFYTTSYDAEYEVVQVKNESYYDVDKVQLDGVTFRTIDDTQTAKEAFSSGEINYFDTSDENLYTEGLDGIDITDRLTGYTFYLSLNNDETRATADKDLREALFYGFDRDTVVEGFSGEINQPIEYYMPKEITEVTYGVEYRDYAKDSYGSFDKERAQKALQRYMDKNSIVDPSDIELEFLVNDSSGGKRTSTALQAAYKQDLGITINVTQLPQQQYAEIRNEGGFDIASGGWGADYADPSTYFDIFTKSNIGSINGPRYANDEYDKAIAEAAKISDIDKRMEAYAAIEQTLMDDYVFVPFYQKNEPYFISEDFEVATHLFLKVSDKYDTYKGE